MEDCYELEACLEDSVSPCLRKRIKRLTTHRDSFTKEATLTKPDRMKRWLSGKVCGKICPILTVAGTIAVATYK